MSNKRNYLFIVTYYKFPCHEAVLENIFAKELGKKLNVIFLFQAAQNNSKSRILKWHNSIVILIKTFENKGLFTKIINKFFSIKKYCVLIKLLLRYRKRGKNILLFRDIPFQLILFLFLRPILKFKLYYQDTAPLGHISLMYANMISGFKKITWLIKGYCHIFFVKFAYIFSDVIFPITKFYVEKYYRSVDKKKIVPLTMGVDREWVLRTPKPQKTLISLKKQNFLICYFGTIALTRKPEFIIEIYYKVKKIQPNVKMILITRENADSLEVKYIKTLCKKLKIEKDIIMFHNLNRNELQDILTCCDLSISPIPPEKFFKISSPTKLYESLANGIPVVANEEIYEQKRVILNSGGGILVPYDKQKFSEAIIFLLNNKLLREKMANKAKKYILDNYSYDIIAKRIEYLFV